MLKADLYRIGKYAMELYQMVDGFEGQGEVDFPHWWQSKVIKSKDALVSAKHYLDFELKEPQIDAMVDVAAEEDVIDENIKSKINSLFKAAQKKLGVKNVVRPTDEDFDAAHKHIEDNYPEGYTLMSIGVDAIQDKINIEVGDFYGESEDIVIDRPSVNEEEGFSFDEKGKPVEKNLDQALKDLFAKIKKQMSDEDKKKLEGAIKEAINSFNETVEVGKNLTEELCAKGKAYIKKRKAAGEKSSAYLSGRAVKVCKGQMKG
jgi:hypothetical protein